MMWATRRQLSGVVKNCWPAICWVAKTSHRRNSARSRPSGWRAMPPVTSAWALITRQSAKRGVSSGPIDRLHEGRRIERQEQAGALEVGGDDAGDVGAELGVLAGADEIRQRDRQRLDVAARHVDRRSSRSAGCGEGRRDERHGEAGRPPGGCGGEWRRSRASLAFWHSSLLLSHRLSRRPFRPDRR